jgi:hypothetical protein
MNWRAFSDAFLNFFFPTSIQDKTSLSMNLSHYHHGIQMFSIMIISGVLSTMNVWADNISDIRFSINDGYMILLMTGWMFVLMGVVQANWGFGTFGVCLVATIAFMIRYQLFVTPRQYIQGMIPHHSMAVFVTRRLLEKNKKQVPKDLQELMQTILQAQREEIATLKAMERRQV